MTALQVRQLGLRPYDGVFQAMKSFSETRDAQTPDQVWLVQHQPVFTQGMAGKAEHVLMPGDIPVVQVDRGGQVTYHGPGQIVAYPLLDIRRRGLGVRQLVSAIENSIVGVLSGLGLEAYARPDAPGVYVDTEHLRGAKIASLGIRVRRGCTYHGLAFNVDMDLSPFLRINPCGYQGLQMTQLKNLLPLEAFPGFSETERLLLDQLADNLGYPGWQYNNNDIPIWDPCNE